jgi:hypothetical protein
MTRAASAAPGANASLSPIVGCTVAGSVKRAHSVHRRHYAVGSFTCPLQRHDVLRRALERLQVVLVGRVDRVSDQEGPVSACHAGPSTAAWVPVVDVVEPAVALGIGSELPAGQ